MIGQVISHYRILEELGRGGMGVVYKAQDLRLDRFVALKFLSEGAISHDDFTRFEQEARIISSLNHKNIATIHDIEVVEGYRFIVFEYLSGGTLKERIRRQGQLTINDVVSIGSQIANGLSYAHSKNLVHRDIKAENIMFAEDGTVKIADFGLSRIKTQSGKTSAGEIAGTIAYMSPEQVQGSHIDHRTDLWSLGVILYEMLTGRLPFHAALQASTIYSILTKPFPPVATFRNDVPTQLEAVVTSCLEKDTAARFQQANDIVHALRAGESPQTTTHRGTTPRKLWWVTAIVGVLLLAYLFVPFQVSTEEIPSVAILYLKNLGPEADEPFSYGITQDLIVDVAKAGWIRVAPMKDILQYKDAQIGLEEIAKSLHVQHILEGSIFRQDDVFKVSAQLVDTKSKRTLWADRLKLKVSDAAVVQGSLARSILRALQVSASKQIEKELTAKRTENPDAYEFYLKAKYKFDYKATKEDVSFAQSLYRKAIELDPGLLPARLGLAETFNLSGDYDEARRIYVEALELARAHGERSAEASCLRGIGLIAWNKGELVQALENYNRGLPIVREIGDRFGEARILNNIGLVFWNQGTYQKALEYYNGSLTIRQELGDLQGQAQTYGNMGLVYWNQYEYFRALDYYNRALKIAEETTDRKLQGSTLNNIGLVYWNQGDYQNALNVYDRSLKLLQGLGDRKGEGQTLNNIGLAYAEIGKYTAALDFYARAEKIHTEIGNRKDLGISFDNIGLVLSEQGEYTKAFDYHKRSLEIAREIGDQGDEAIRLQSLGICSMRRGKLSDAIEYFTQSEKLFIQSTDTLNLIATFSYAGVSLIDFGTKEEIQRLAGTIEKLATAVQHLSEPVTVFWNISRMYAAIEDHAGAKKYLERAYGELDARVKKMQDEKLRRSFLSDVQVNIEVLRAWNAATTAKQ